MNNTLRALVFVSVAGASSAFGQSFIGNPAPSAGQSGIFAYWSFNSLGIATANTPGNGDVPVSISADFGSGASVSLGGWAGTVDDFAGSTLNAQNGDASGGSLSLIASGPSGGPYPGNGSYLQFSFSMVGLEGLTVSFAARGTSTGFDTGQWSYSTNGADFTNFGVSTGTRSTTFSVVSASLEPLTMLDGQSMVFLRYVLNGATSGSGNNRIDNITFTATSAVPEPSAYAALAGVAAISAVMARRRTRR